MRVYLLTVALRGPVNVPALGMKELSLLQPYVSLAESLGRFQAQLTDKAVSEVRLEFAGEIVDVDATPVTRAFLAGLLRDGRARGNVVNALLIEEESGASKSRARTCARAPTSRPRSVRKSQPNKQRAVSRELSSVTVNNGAKDASRRSTAFTSKRRRKATCS